MNVGAVIPGEDTFASSEEKIYCNATIDDDFAEDRILVVLSNDASLSTLSYNETHFSEFSCTDVTNLTEFSTNLVRAQLAKVDIAEQYQLSDAVTFGDFYQVDTDSFHQVLCLTLKDPGKDQVLSAIDDLMQREDVIYAGPDFVVSCCSTSPQGAYCDEQWAIETIQLPEAWDISTGSASVMIGVLDSGIDGSHPDLANRINVSKSRDFTSGTTATVSSVTDPFGHGTHVAGIIAAQGTNTIGITGVCKYATLISLRVFNSIGRGYSSYVANAINYASSIGIPILNFSGGWWTYEDRYDYALKTVISSYSGLFVCAAGNDSLDLDTASDSYYPAEYHLSNMIVVGSSTSEDTYYFTSNYSEKVVDIFAPGSNILSCYTVSKCENGTHDISGTTHYKNGYHYDNGTSMAAPHVAGVAALILAKHPSATRSQIKKWILNGAERVLNANGNSVFGALCVSGGRLNAFNAVNNHLYTYTKYSSTQHTCSCECGYSKKESHTWTTISTADTSADAGINSTTTYCAKCGYVRGTL